MNVKECFFGKSCDRLYYSIFLGKSVDWVVGILGWFYITKVMIVDLVSLSDQNLKQISL